MLLKLLKPDQLFLKHHHSIASTMLHATNSLCISRLWQSQKCGLYRTQSHNHLHLDSQGQPMEGFKFRATRQKTSRKT